MHIVIFTVGKESSPAISQLQETYQKRIQPYSSIEWKTFSPSRFTDPDQIREEESVALFKALKPTDSVILLDERGVQQSNAEFARTFEKLSGSHGRLVMIIGGAFGVNGALRDKASFVWSFSSLVFPHQLVRVMLLEQIYRTYMVLNNHPYHHT
jgi:23S rRNA (pseudouridine1915-N3)-methyltransferase